MRHNLKGKSSVLDQSSDMPPLKQPRVAANESISPLATSTNPRRTTTLAAVAGSKAVSPSPDLKKHRRTMSDAAANFEIGGGNMSPAPALK